MTPHTTKKCRANPGGGSRGSRNGGVRHCTWWVLRIQGCIVGIPPGPQKHRHKEQKRKDARELLQGEMLSQHPPARPFRSQAQVVPNAPQGKRGSFSVCFHFTCTVWVQGGGYSLQEQRWFYVDTALIKQQMLSPIAPMSTGTAGKMLRGTWGHMTAMLLRGWEWRTPSTPMEPPGSPIWCSPLSLFPVPGRCHSSTPGRAGLDSAQAGW